MVLSKENKEQIIKTHKQSDSDTGSTKVQISLLTHRINYLADHLKKNKKDHHSRRGLLVLVGKRKRLMNYLERTDSKGFKSLTKTLGL